MDGAAPAVSPIPEHYHLPGFYEPFSSISHLIGAVVFLVLGILLLRLAGLMGTFDFLGIYVFSGVFLFSMSAVYHMLETRWRRALGLGAVGPLRNLCAHRGNVYAGAWDIVSRLLAVDSVACSLVGCDRGPYAQDDFL